MPKVLLRSEESGGAVSVIDNVVPAGLAGPPLHVHDFDEAFYVLEGELTFQADRHAASTTSTQNGDTISMPSVVWNSLRDRPPIEDFERLAQE